MAKRPAGGAKLSAIVHKLRTQCWCAEVISTSGLTVAALESDFSTGLSGKDGHPRSCIWQKYKTGKVTPSEELLARVDGKYPGTAARFYSPVWRLVDPAPLTMTEIRDIYDHLPARLRQLFIDSEVDEPFPRFWRIRRERSYTPGMLCNELVVYPGWIALVTLLAFLRESELTQDERSFNAALEAIQKHLKAFGLSDAARIMFRSHLESFVEDVS